MRKLMVLAAGLLVFLGSLGAFVSLGLFTDTAQIQSGSFTTGTLDVDLSDDNETDQDNLVNTQLTFSAMAPGDQAQPDNGITVKNTGSLALRYALYASGTDVDGKNLKDALEITIRAADTASANAGESPVKQCDDFDGTLIYGPGTNYDGAAAAGTFVAIFGNSVAGPDAGDRDLASAASEVLCFRIKLPVTAGNSLQNATTTITWEFRAEQTKNNP